MISLTSEEQTLWHRVRAGPKLFSVCVFTIVVFSTADLLWMCGYAGLVVIGYLAGGLRFATEGARALRPLLFFMAVLGLWHGITSTYADGAQIALRLVAAVGAANLLTMTTRLSDMLALLNWLLTPLRRLGVSTRKLEIAIAMVIRFTPVLAQKGRQLSESWRARSPRRPGWRTVIPLVVLALDDADHVAEALRARGGVGGVNEPNL